MEFTQAKKDKEIIYGTTKARSLDDLVAESNIIAHVKILKLVDVFEDEGEQISKFQAKVKKYYKNNTDNNDAEEIYLYQLGSPDVDVVDNPLLEENKSYILFLKERDGGSKYGKVLIMTGEGYGRYNVNGTNVIPQLVHLNESNEESNLSPVPLEDFEKKLDKKIKTNLDSLNP
ncbi:hypothetical protein G3578_12295 [Brevibacillus sp. SYP-B805]|uniref:hypothetical protein n=1 Tax=Brevibacillus sp. SYP-B805 TaxID=1578199 RepID=UPI0013EBFA4E|nr:hypothetical protein [Brevibacillus sp. SYP-B805]NGQ95937.1 hypothetical protein [Brevibacillus sp. SYP-B805]